MFIYCGLVYLNTQGYVLLKFNSGGFLFSSGSMGICIAHVVGVWYGNFNNFSLVSTAYSERGFIFNLWFGDPVHRPYLFSANSRPYG
jgi:hypothetical protein